MTLLNNLLKFYF